MTRELTFLLNCENVTLSTKWPLILSYRLYIYYDEHGLSDICLAISWNLNCLSYVNLNYIIYYKYIS